MPDFVDLKRTSADKKEFKEDISFGDEDYAYGTRLHLDDIEADKLGLMDMNVGDEVELAGMAKVIGKSVRESQGTGKNGHVELQITMLAVQTASDKESAAQRLYGDASDDNNEG